VEASETRGVPVVTNCVPVGNSGVSIVPTRWYVVRALTPAQWCFQGCSSGVAVVHASGNPVVASDNPVITSGNPVVSSTNLNNSELELHWPLLVTPLVTTGS
jgi:hypothetical protein